MPSTGDPLGVETHRGDQLVGVGRVSVASGEVPDEFLDRELVMAAGTLQHDADPLPPPRTRVARVGAEHAYVTGVAAAVTLEDLDGGGLAGAVRPEVDDSVGRWDVASTDQWTRAGAT
jgi:hypothetical protein